MGSKIFTDDPTVYPIRGQNEISNFDTSNNPSSLNFPSINAYVLFRPQSKQCILGTTYQKGDTFDRPQKEDTIAIMQKIKPLFPTAATLATTAKVGFRCGRFDVRIEGETVLNNQGKAKRHSLLWAWRQRFGRFMGKCLSSIAAG